MRGSDPSGPELHGDISPRRSGHGGGVFPPDFAERAVAAARALQDWHSRWGPHEGVRPQAFAGADAAGPVTLRAVAPNRVAAVGYAAPEETGRLSSGVDERTDLYSLGVLFYEQLTGHLPFADQPAERARRGHLTVRPVRPGAFVERVPDTIEEIVLRLLEKAPQDRYRTARGVAADLDAWLRVQHGGAGARTLPLGLHDVADRLRLDARVNLKQPRLGGLHKAYERVAATRTAEVVIVTGDAGLGKAALVCGFADAVVLTGGRVLNAACSPDTVGGYPLLTALLTELRAQLADASAGDRQRLAQAIGRHVAELDALVPGLAAVLGAPAQPANRPVPGPVPGAGNRLRSGVRRLLRAVAEADQPLVVVVRDVQWADEASVTVLTWLLSDPDDLPMLLLATSQPAANVATEALRRVPAGAARTGLTSVKMRPLSDSAVTDLLTRTLGARSAEAAQLARIIAANAAANPLRIGQVLADLADRGRIVCREPGKAWHWRLDDLAEAPWSATIGELTAARVGRLPEPVRRVLYAASYAGLRFDAETIAAAVSSPIAEVAAALRQAVVAQFVVRCADPAPEWSTGRAYRWIHEEVRAAVLGHVPACERKAYDLAVGQSVAVQPEPDRMELGVSRLNAAAQLLAPAERRRLAALNHAAGRRAAAVDANHAAGTFFAAALALTEGPDGAGVADRERAFALCLDAAHTAARRGDPRQTAALLQRAAAYAGGPLDEARILAVRVAAHREAGDWDSAAGTALEALAALDADPARGESAPAVAARTAIDRVRARLAGLRPAELAAAEAATDTATLIAAEILATVLSPARDGPAHELLVAAGVELTLNRGRTPCAALAFACLAVDETRRGEDGEAARRYLRIAQRLLDATSQSRRAGAVRAAVAMVLPAWFDSADMAVMQLDAAHAAAEDEGDAECAAAARILAAAHRFALGHPLGEVARSVEDALRFAERSGITGAIVGAGRHLAGAVARLRGVPAGETVAEPGGALGYASLVAIDGPLTAAYLLGDRDAAAELAAAGERAGDQTPGTYLGADIACTKALLLAESGAPDSDDAFPAPHRRLDELAARAPDVFAARAMVVAAARAHEPGADQHTPSRYDRAIQAARKEGSLPLEALAAELGGRHALATGRSSEAVAYLRRARDCYSRWGADAKAAQITETLAAGPLPGTSAGPTDRLELLTVLKTFQTITAELRLDRLVELLLTQFIEHSGGERGELHLVDGERLHLAGAAYANLDGTRVTLEPLASGAPAGLIEQVRHDRHTAIDEPATRMCTPIVHGDKVTGVLYLERDRPPSFTQDRADLIEVLCAQAGIALENAALHARLTRANRVLDATFDQLPLGLILLGPDLTVLRASPLAITMTGLPIAPGTPLVDLFDVLGPTNVAGTPFRFEPALAAQALTAQPIHREMIIVQPTGHRQRLTLTAVPLRDPAKTLVGVMLLIAEQPGPPAP